MCFFAAPLASLLHVIRAKNSESLPLPLIATSFVVSLQWLIYGILISDSFIQVNHFPRLASQTANYDGVCLFCFFRFPTFWAAYCRCCSWVCSSSTRREATPATATSWSNRQCRFRQLIGPSHAFRFGLRACRTQGLYIHAACLGARLIYYRHT